MFKKGDFVQLKDRKVGVITEVIGTKLRSEFDVSYMVEIPAKGAFFNRNLEKRQVDASVLKPVNQEVYEAYKRQMW